jgi:hypothetical protein
VEVVKTRAPRALEASLVRLDAVRDALLGATDSGTRLETLSLAEFERLGRELPGVLFGREESPLVKLDPEFFLDLAGRYGDAADRAFFAAYKETYPDGVWAAYLQPRTDYSGCTVFGSGRLVGAYRRWSSFSLEFRDRYAARTVAELEQVGQQLQSTCACADATSVEQELQQFLLTFPQSSIFGPIRDRLQAIRGGRSKIRFHCTSGNSPDAAHEAC